MRRLISLVFCGALLLDARASGQEGAPPAGNTPRAPVLVAMVDSLSGEPRFRIMRLADASVRDVILLPPDADAALLSEAAHALRLVWAHGGGRRDAPAQFRIRRTNTKTPAPRLLLWAERVVADLRAAPQANVPGVGRARVVRIWLARLPPAAILP